MSWVFIPGLVQDNRKLLDKDPGYRAALFRATAGNPALRAAWLMGDWNALSGAFFQNYAAWKDAGGVLHPFRIPSHWGRFLAMDYGSARPFCVLWVAVAPASCMTHRGITIPEGSLVVYREWYGAATDERGELMPDVGIKMPATEIGLQIGRLSKFEPRRKWSVIDPSAFKEEGGPSVATRILEGERASGVEISPWYPADNARVNDGGHIGGWDRVRELMGDARTLATERPRLYVFETCRHVLRTLPMMVHDPNRPEDMLKKGKEDHAVDTLRYAVMAEYGNFDPSSRKRESSYREPTIGDLFQEVGIVSSSGRVL